MNLILKTFKNISKKKKRVGRGFSSGKGKTAGRGTKGQNARAKRYAPYFGFEGGQKPIYRIIPKRGFTNNRFKKKIQIINISDLNLFEDNTLVNIKSFKERNMVPKTTKYIKILGNGNLNKKVHIEAFKISKKAMEKIKKLEGSFKIVAPKKFKKLKKGVR